MNLNLTPSARADLRDIRAFIAEENDRTADNVISRLRASMETLRILPAAGRPGRIEGTREWSVPGLPYFIVYTVEGATDLDIVSVVHERRDYPFR